MDAKWKYTKDQLILYPELVCPEVIKVIADTSEPYLDLHHLAYTFTEVSFEEAADLVS